MTFTSAEIEYAARIARQVLDSGAASGNEQEKPMNIGAKSCPACGAVEGGLPLPERNSKPLQRQEGGQHYRGYPIQPVEYIVANGIGFLAGNVIKYVTRYKDKGGAADIRKAIHYLELILEFEYPNVVNSASNQQEQQCRK